MPGRRAYDGAAGSVISSRAMIDAVIDDLLPQLSTETYQRAVEIARLPDLVRGYENIKLANVALYRARVKELQDELATVSC